MWKHPTSLDQHLKVLEIIWSLQGILYLFYSILVFQLLRVNSSLGLLFLSRYRICVFEVALREICLGYVIALDQWSSNFTKLRMCGLSHSASRIRSEVCHCPQNIHSTQEKWCYITQADVNTCAWADELINEEQNPKPLFNRILSHHLHML